MDRDPECSLNFQAKMLIFEAGLNVRPLFLRVWTNLLQDSAAATYRAALIECWMRNPWAVTVRRRQTQQRLSGQRQSVLKSEAQQNCPAQPAIELSGSPAARARSITVWFALGTKRNAATNRTNPIGEMARVESTPALKSPLFTAET